MKQMLKKELDNLRAGEIELIAAGGILWCMTQSIEGGWDIYKIDCGGKEYFSKPIESKCRAEDWVFALALLSSFTNEVNVHHSIERKNSTNEIIFPTISD